MRYVSPLFSIVSRRIILTTSAIDIPAHCYQLSFESNPAWSSFYARAPEILEYWKRVADKYGIRKYMRLSHKAVEARWDEETSKWVVKVENIKTGEVLEDTADALLTGIGALNEYTSIHPYSRSS